MKILSISSDRKVFEQNSAVRSRLLEYGELVDELHVIVFAKRSLGLKEESLHPDIFLYPTNAHTRWWHIPHAIAQALVIKKCGVHIDVVTAQDPFESGLAAYLIAHILDAKLHLQVHTDLMSPYFAAESFLNRIRVRLARFLLPRADAVRVVSKRIKNSLAGIVAFGASIKILPIFIDAEINDSASVDLKKKYPQFKKHILMASRLSPEKNIPLALEVMREIVAKSSDVGLVVVGSGSEETYLKKLTEDLGLAKNVVFEGWQNDLASYCKTADLFLLTSNYEGYGMAVVEALLVGCPVVMTDVGCAGDVVRNGKNGLVVPVGDGKAIETAVLKVISGEVQLRAKTIKLTTKEEYLAAYLVSLEDALKNRAN